ncbi:MAG: YeiH family protein [Planctomycetaceae bacterium]
MTASPPPPAETIRSTAHGWHEDAAAILVGGLLVALALVVGWAGRPAADAGSRAAHPKGWTNPLGATINKPQTWNDSPAEALADRKGKPVTSAIVLGMGWVVAVIVSGAVICGRRALGVIPGAALLALLGALAYLLAAQKVIHFYNLEYPLWALLVGLVVGNTVGVPHWLAPAVQGEYLVKTGLVLFGAEVLFSRLLELGLPGLLTSWVVTPIVLVGTYLLGTRWLRIPSRSLCMVISADMSVCGVSAAIATGAACRAKKEELSLAIGLSLAFTALMMVAMPPFIRWAGIDPIVGGAWLGGTIDATGAVAAAGEILGRDLGDKRPAEVATTVKMIQNSMIGVIAFAVALYWSGWVERGAQQARRSLAAEAWLRFPKFILGFIAASIVCSWLVTRSPESALWIDGAIDGFTGRLRGWLFCVGFVCMGLQTVFRELAPVFVSGRPLALYVIGQAFNLVLSLAMASLTFGWLFRQGVGG